ncbi:tetratricopeptide repeat protein [Methyloceanibacter caenitepidi]|uniref:tetratricopeptide repeat protein n=1 Tax=Methyloceanibacter caenitepidi TaxID=1384459 RepID=UPI0012E097F4|nr:tetratricopeptide repeat protein [Methyloceanibacter caenitepidi]
MRLPGQKLGLCLLGVALLVPAPVFAGPPTVLAQFFEQFDDEAGPPPSEDPGLGGLDFEDMEESDLGAGPERVPGWASGEAPGEGEEAIAGAVPPAFDPAERPVLLEGLYERLAQAKSSTEAEPITEAIEELWAMSGSDTVDLLMSRATQFANDSDVDLSLAVLDAVVDIAPDEAEAWYLRAKVNVLAGKPERALSDLRRALNLDEKHYRAITDLGLVLEQLGAKKEALKAYRQALAVNPYLDDAQAGVDALSREVEGQDI